MAEDNGDSLRSAENDIQSIESETPGVTIRVLQDMLADKTARVKELEMKVKELEDLVVFAKDFCHEMMVKSVLKHQIQKIYCS